MENSIIINDIKHIEKASNFDRVYFGCEFCEELFPCENDIFTALAYSKKRGMNFSLLTPYVTDKGIAKLRPVLSKLKDCEVIINDWGVYRLASQNLCLTPVLGRLLVKQKKGPRILNRKLPKDAVLHFKRTNIQPGFLKSLGIRRIEADMPLQGLCLPSDMKGISVSIYHPYVYITTTRSCLFSGSVGKCDKECLKKSFELSHPCMPTKIILRGNSQFYINKNIKKERPASRMVFEPGVPM